MRKEAPPVDPLSVDDISASRAVFPFDDQDRAVEGLTNDRQRKIYEMRCKSLAAMGVMEEAYQEAMILYAIWLDRALCYAKEVVKGEVFTQKDDNGNVTGYIENPYIRLLERATKMVNEIGRQFGFTALTRNNIKQTEKQIDPMATLQKMIDGK